MDRRLGRGSRPGLSASLARTLQGRHQGHEQALFFARGGSSSQPVVAPLRVGVAPEATMAVGKNKRISKGKKGGKKKT